MIIFRKICIIGLGLIGGSIGMAARKRRLAREVRGLVRRPESVREARMRGAVDRASLDPAEALAGADLAIIAVTLGATERVAERIRQHLPAGCIVTDVGSCKRLVLRRAARALGRGVRFVGGHPIAGSERSGIRAARADLFEGAPCILTPARGTDMVALEVVRGFWEKLGARVALLSPSEHDRVVAAISHLPHFIAASLVNASLKTLGKEKMILDYAGSGFRDATRLAAGSPDMWAEIGMDNSDEIVRSLDEFTRNVSLLRNALRGRKRASLRALLGRAGALRGRLPAG